MLKPALVLAAVALGCATAAAHIVVDPAEAPVGSSVRATFRVTHGCDGAATTELRVVVPEGFIGVKPMPKPGWSLKTETGKYQGSYAYYHGKTLSEGVTAVAWSGGELPDAYVDEFTLFGFAARELKPGEVLRFAVIQDCAGGKTTQWTEIAKSADDHPERPAPGVTLTPGAEPHHH